MTTPIHWLTATDLASMLRSGECSAREATEAILARIEELDPKLHAYASVVADEARSAAERADEELSAGKDRGPLHGIPIAVKDLCAVTGLATAAGTRVLRDRVAEEDACVVARLREAGAVLLGTTQMTEGAYAMHHPDVEPPRNPWDAERWTGVSSSGSGVATASGLCFGSLGTDTGGSIRLPSAANGVVGIKPTYGRVSRRGVFPLAASLDHVGPFARSVRDAANILAAIAGFDAGDPTSLGAEVPDYGSTIGDGIGAIRIGVDESYICEGMDPEITGPILECVAVFREAGAEIHEVSMPPWMDMVEAWTPICAAEAALAHEGLFPERADEYGPFLRLLLEGGHALPAVELARWFEARSVFSGRLRRIFDEIDLLFCPTMGMPIPPSVPDLSDPLATLAILRFTAPFDMSGSPTISLPCGFTADGMPLSLQLVGRHLEEELLCRAGFVFEQATDWHRRHPPV